MRNVVGQRPERGRARRCARLLPAHQRHRVQTGDESGGGRLHVALDAGHLAGDEQAGAAAGLPRRREHGRRVDVGVAVDRSEPHELGPLQTRNQPQHAPLFGPLELRLKADQAEVVGREVVLAELRDGVRLPSGGRIGEADRLHGAEPQGVDPAVGRHLDRQAALEERRAVEVAQLGPLRGQERGVEPPVLRRVQGTVQVVPRVLTVRAAGPAGRRLARPFPADAARGAEDLRPVDRAGLHDGADRVVEIELLAADQGGEAGGELR